MPDGNEWMCAACCPLAAGVRAALQERVGGRTPWRERASRSSSLRTGRENKTAQILSVPSATVHVSSPSVSEHFIAEGRNSTILKDAAAHLDTLTIKGLLDMLGEAIGCPKGVMEGLFWPKTGYAGPWGSTENVKRIAYLNRSHFPTPLCWLRGAGTGLGYSWRVAIIALHQIKNHSVGRRKEITKELSLELLHSGSIDHIRSSRWPVCGASAD